MEEESAGRHDWPSQKFCNDIATINSERGSGNDRYLRIANMRRERLNVADRRQAEWGTGLETFEEKRS
jgi:hypothetical protein